MTGWIRRTAAGAVTVAVATATITSASGRTPSTPRSPVPPNSVASAAAPLRGAAAVRAEWGLRHDSGWIAYVDTLRPRTLRFDIPVTTAEAANLDRRSELTAPALAVERAAKAAFPGRYAGVWMDQATPNGAVVVAVTGPAPDQLTALRHLVPSWAEFRVVADCRYTKASLDGLMSRISDDEGDWYERGIPIWSVGTDEKANRVNVAIDDQSPPGAEAELVGRYGNAVMVERQRGPAVAD